MNNNNFIYKPLAIVQDKRLTPLEQDYLCLIAALQNANGCTAHNKYFANYFRVSRPRAVEVITSLRKKGFIGSTEKKQGGKTIERTILIIDIDSKKTLLTNSKESLLSDSKELPAGLVRKTDFDSKESPTHIIKGTTKNNNKTSFCPNSVELRLAELLLNEIIKRKPDFRKPNLQQWAKDIDQTIRLDKRTPEQIEAVIRWTQQDSFWQNNVLSTATLREKFDQLELKMKNPQSKKQQFKFGCQKTNYGREIEVKNYTGRCR